MSTVKKYKLSVPVMNVNFYKFMNREKTVEIMKKMGVDRVFIAAESNTFEGERKSEELIAMKANVDFLHKHGFEVGAWFWTFINNKDGLVMMTSPDGRVSKDVVCPTDKTHRELMFSFIKDCAETGIDMLMFDDDYRYGFHDIDFGCLCENHHKMICDYLGENVSRETIADGILNGGKNKYRDAFIAANGIALEDFARKCRESLDSINPDIRFGFCSCITSWDIDGTTPDRIAKLLAGKTKPFYRLIGAPYWASMGSWGFSRISYVIEQERLEAQSRNDSDIEIFSEGDTFPRPRHFVPSAYLECLDTVLRADGCTDGILKYSFDYAADCDYETGYNENHIRNLPAYEMIDRLFSDKTTVGVRVFDNMTKFNDVAMPTNEKNPADVQLLAFNTSARFLASNSIPSVYSGNEYGGIAFGEDAKILTEKDISSGLILDYPAAKILAEKGIDTGIRGNAEFVKMGSTEYFSDVEKTGHLRHINIYKTDIAESAELESWTILDNKKIPLCYKYENSDNQRFVVYTFDGYSADEEIFRNYERQKQVIGAVKWLTGKSLPVSCAGHPDLYILAKRKDNRLSVLLWNTFPDKIYSPKLEFEKEIRSAEIFRADSAFDKNILTLSEISPYDFVAVEISF